MRFMAARREGGLAFPVRPHARLHHTVNTVNNYCCSTPPLCATRAGEFCTPGAPSLPNNKKWTSQAKAARSGAWQHSPDAGPRQTRRARRGRTCCRCACPGSPTKDRSRVISVHPQAHSLLVQKTHACRRVATSASKSLHHTFVYPLQCTTTVSPG